MTAILRIFAWLLAAAVTFATLGPARYRPHSDLSHGGEHALAFVLVGLAFGLAYRQSRLLATIIAVVLTGVLELLQRWAPGRHARLKDFVIDAMAVCVGFAIVAIMDYAATWSQRRIAGSREVTD
jgi:VanZ family protein